MDAAPEFLSLLEGMLRDKERPKVSIDIDGTVADIFVAIANHHNSRHGTDYPYTHFAYQPRFNIPGVWEAEVRPIYNHIWMNGAYEHVPFLADRGLLAELKVHYDPAYVTSRDPLTAPGLSRYLKQNGADHFSELCVKADKANLDYDLYIDDLPELTRSVSSKPHKLLFFVDRGYAREYFVPHQAPNIQRVEHVDQALTMLARTAERVRAPSKAKQKA